MDEPVNPTAGAAGSAPDGPRDRRDDLGSLTEHQPPSQRVDDLIPWAVTILERHERWKASATAHPSAPTMGPPDEDETVTGLETLLEEARRFDLGRVEDRFRLGELAEEMRRELLTRDVFERLAIDLEVDATLITEAWFVADAFPPATRRPGLPWVIYVILRYHPERHELVSLAARHGWDQARVERELADRFSARFERGDG
jgi:hypothetical protein